MKRGSKADSEAWYKWRKTPEAQSLNLGDGFRGYEDIAFLAGWRYAKRHTKRKRKQSTWQPQ